VTSSQNADNNTQLEDSHLHRLTSLKHAHNRTRQQYKQQEYKAANNQTSNTSALALIVESTQLQDNTPPQPFP
jgi:hypothetical protein